MGCRDHTSAFAPTPVATDQKRAGRRNASARRTYYLSLHDDRTHGDVVGLRARDAGDEQASVRRSERGRELLESGRGNGICAKEPFAKPITVQKVMGIASLNPSYRFYLPNARRCAS